MPRPPRVLAPVLSAVLMATVSPRAFAAACASVPEANDRCPVWTSDYDNGGQDVPAGAAMSPSGDALFVAAFSADGPDGEIQTATVALDPETGARRWVAREAGPGPSDPYHYDLAVSPDGSRVYVVGALDWATGGCGENPCEDAFVAAYHASTGDRLWKRTVDGPVGGWDYLSGVAVSPDGSRVFVAGASQGVENSGFPGVFDRATLDVLTMGLAAADGEVLWSARYDRVAGEYDAASSIAVSPDGMRVFVGGNTAGQFASDGDTDYLTLAYASGLVEEEGQPKGGDLLWASRYDSAVPKDLVLPWDVANDLAVAPDGSRVYVTGQLGANRQSTGTELFYNVPTDYGTVAYDAADGDVEWVARYPGVAGGYNIALDLALAPSGDRVYVTGISSGQGWENTNDRDAAVVAYDAADGSQEWDAAYVPGYAYGWGLAVRGDFVYLAASSTRFSATIALATDTGTKEWTAIGTPVSDEGELEHLEARGILAGADRVLGFGVAYPLIGQSDARIQAYEL